MSVNYGLIAVMSGVALMTACATPNAPSSEVVGQAPAPNPFVESLTIDFDVSGMTLSPHASSQLDGAARLYRNAQPEVMIISGHSDKSGEEFANLILSARRAAVVKRALVDRGIPDDRLQIVADGEAQRVASIFPSRSAVVTWR